MFSSGVVLAFTIFFLASLPTGASYDLNQCLFGNDDLTRTSLEPKFKIGQLQSNSQVVGEYSVFATQKVTIRNDSTYDKADFFLRGVDLR